MNMGQLVEEVKIWNTPVIGAYLLWRFTDGYTKNHPEGDAPIGILHFISIGLLTNQRYLELISDRREDLQSFVRSFEYTKDSDLLLSIQARIKSKLQYTLDALDIATLQGLLIWDVETGKIYSQNNIGNPKRGNGLKQYYKSVGAKAEILGKWFSQHDLNSIASYLKVVL